MKPAGSLDRPGGRATTVHPLGRNRLVAWALVAAQFLLIGAIVLLPDGGTWPVPSWLALVGTAGTWSGIVIMVGGGLGLGRGLTAAPLPNAHAQLRTGGLYRFVRHPIYTGLLLFTAAQVVASGSVAAAVSGVLLVVLINGKARWEERRLAERFPDYAAYARTTPRFVPGRTLARWRHEADGP
jgi:protein-S-isoprenylcysteine O-methyltransferase Ste14